MNRARLGDLAVGSAFAAFWQEPPNIGELQRIGTGSCTVRIPNRSGGGFEVTHWSMSTEVEPVDRDELAKQFAETDPRRERSTTESPVQKVHAICDEMKGRPRDEILEACVKQGININTAKTQYYAWRRIQR